jgi:hypothetical protein
MDPVKSPPRSEQVSKLKIVEMSVEIIFPSGGRMNRFLKQEGSIEAWSASNSLVFNEIRTLLLNH